MNFLMRRARLRVGLLGTLSVVGACAGCCLRNPALDELEELRVATAAAAVGGGGDGAPGVEAVLGGAGAAVLRALLLGRAADDMA